MFDIELPEQPVWSNYEPVQTIEALHRRITELEAENATLKAELEGAIKELRLKTTLNGELMDRVGERNLEAYFKVRSEFKDKAALWDWCCENIDAVNHLSYERNEYRVWTKEHKYYQGDETYAKGETLEAALKAAQSKAKEKERR